MTQTPTVRSRRERRMKKNLTRVMLMKLELLRSLITTLVVVTRNARSAMLPRLTLSFYHANIRPAPLVPRD